MSVKIQPYNDLRLTFCFGLHSLQNHSPSGMRFSFGLRQYMWWPRSQPSQINIFSGSLFFRQMRHLIFNKDLKTWGKRLINATCTICLIEQCLTVEYIYFDHRTDDSRVVRWMKSWAAEVEAMRLVSQSWKGVVKWVSVLEVLRTLPSPPSPASAASSASFFRRSSSRFSLFFLAFSSSPRGDFKYFSSNIWSKKYEGTLKISILKACNVSNFSFASAFLPTRLFH